jgi:hypothetical protein
MAADGFRGSDPGWSHLVSAIPAELVGPTGLWAAVLRYAGLAIFAGIIVFISYRLLS